MKSTKVMLPGALTSCTSGWALMPEVALDNFKGYVKPCTFENGEPFVRRTYIFCQRDAAALPQVQLFMDMLKKHR